MTDATVTSALVTGSNRGLGLEFVKQLADSVDRLFATCRRPAEAETLTELAKSRSGTIEVRSLDVTDPAAITEMAEHVRRSSGELDLLINNAGISGGGQRDRFDVVDQDTMMEVFQVNAAGPHLMTKAFSDLLRNGAATDRAIVVNVTSQLGSIANAQTDNWHSYRASKAALNMCTRLQAAALRADGVIAVAMHPGWVQTDMGGASARLSTEESVSGMMDVIANLSLDDTGRFLDYSGRELPW